MQCSMGIPAGIVNASFRCIPPLEDTIAGDGTLEGIGHDGYLQVLQVGNETATVPPSSRTDCKGDHIATLEFEGLDTVVELGIGKGLHETAIMSLGVSIIAVTLIVLVCVTGQGLITTAIGEDNGSAVEHPHLAVGVVDSLLAIDEDVSLEYLADYLTRTEILDDDYSMLYVLDVHAAHRPKGFFTSDGVVDIIGQGNTLTHLLHTGRDIFRLQRKRTEKQCRSYEKFVGFHCFDF